MTREEAIHVLEEIKGYLESDDASLDCRRAVAGLDFAVSALHPVSREKVEKAWKGNWKFEPDVYDSATYVCGKCGEPWTLIDGTPAENNMNFCPNCGAAITDEAVEMVMERLEALKDES